MTGIFYLFPSKQRKTPLPACWCRAGSAWACADGTRAKPEYLCGVHAIAWAQNRALAMPKQPSAQPSAISGQLNRCELKAESCPLKAVL
jgi:hypothetical protein